MDKITKNKYHGLNYLLEQNHIKLAFALTQSGVPLSLLFPKSECRHLKKQFKNYKLK